MWNYLKYTRTISFEISQTISYTLNIRKRIASTRDTEHRVHTPLARVTFILEQKKEILNQNNETKFPMNYFHLQDEISCITA